MLRNFYPYVYADEYRMSWKFCRNELGIMFKTREFAKLY
jgi:hypothetical protein